MHYNTLQTMEMHPLFVGSEGELVLTGLEVGGVVVEEGSVPM